MAVSFGLTVGKKISLLAALVSLLGMGSVAWVSTRLIESQIASQSRDSAEQIASLLSASVDQELRSVSERSRLLIAAALADFRNRGEQLRLLEDSLISDDGVFAVTLYTRSEEGSAQWTPSIRLTRPENDPGFVSESDLHDLDTRSPLQFDFVQKGSSELVAARLQDRFPIVRFAFPLEHASNQGPRVISVEFHQEKLAALFSKNAPQFSALLDRRHRVILQSEPAHFAFGEDASTLPILQSAASSDIKNGRMDFSEIPGGPGYYGAFSKTPRGNLLVVTEAPQKDVIEAWRAYLEGASLGMGAGWIAILLLAWAVSWFLFAVPLERLAKGVELLEEGKVPASIADRFAPETGLDDEIGNLARALRRLSVGFQTKKKAPRKKGKTTLLTLAPIMDDPVATHAPMTDATETAVHADQNRAMILHCSFNGIEKQTQSSDPETVHHHMTELKKALTEVIECQLGEIASNGNADSLIGIWPVSEGKNLAPMAERVLEVSLALSALFKEIKKQGLPEVSLTQGLHYGPTRDTDTAARIASFATGLGAEILLTRALLDHAPQWFSTEKVAPADDDNPEIHELSGKVASVQTDAEPHIA